MRLLGPASRGARAACRCRCIRPPPQPLAAVQAWNPPAATPLSAPTPPRPHAPQCGRRCASGRCLHGRCAPCPRGKAECGGQCVAPARHFTNTRHVRATQARGACTCCAAWLRRAERSCAAQLFMTQPARMPRPSLAVALPCPDTVRRLQRGLPCWPAVPSRHQWAPRVLGICASPTPVQAPAPAALPGHRPDVRGPAGLCAVLRCGRAVRARLRPAHRSLRLCAAAHEPRRPRRGGHQPDAHRAQHDQRRAGRRRQQRGLQQCVLSGAAHRGGSSHAAPPARGSHRHQDPGQPRLHVCGRPARRWCAARAAAGRAAAGPMRRRCFQGDVRRRTASDVSTVACLLARACLLCALCRRRIHS